MMSMAANTGSTVAAKGPLIAPVIRLFNPAGWY